MENREDRRREVCKVRIWMYGKAISCWVIYWYLYIEREKEKEKGREKERERETRESQVRTADAGPSKTSHLR